MKLLLLLSLCCSSAFAAELYADLRSGAVVLYRHANAPGVGDPPDMKLGDCRTQRNLDALGRAQAKKIGEQLRGKKVVAGRVVSSQWCRALETARLMNLRAVEESAALNSFFQRTETKADNTRAARELILAWRGPGAMVLVTHQVNIGALTGEFADVGEGVVVRVLAGELKVLGKLTAP